MDDTEEKLKELDRHIEEMEYYMSRRVLTWPIELDPFWIHLQQLEKVKEILCSRQKKRLLQSTE